MAFDSGSWAAIGTIATPATFGIAVGSVVADADAVQLSDGRVRLYMYVEDVGVRSLISDDGTTFSLEDGIRVAGAAGMPRISALTDGTYRLFYTGPDGVQSSISSDGLTFTQEEGYRLTYADAGGQITAPAVLATGDGYRAYYSDLPVAGATVTSHAVSSAASSDMTTFTPESGVRVGTGATVTESAEHPEAVLNDDGSVTLFYGTNQPSPGASGPVSISYATASDGVTFSSSGTTGLTGNDPSILVTTDGGTLIYYGDFDAATGGTILVGRFIESVASVATDGADAIAGTSGSNQVSGAAGDDTLTGLGGADVIYGNVGADVLYGNTGLDTIYGGADGDSIYSGQNTGTASGGLLDVPALRGGTEAAYGGAGNDLIYGNHGSDQLYGEDGDDTLYGGQEADSLDGGAGADTLRGDLGDDALAGGSGADLFHIGHGADSIADFDGGGGDRISADAVRSGITDGASGAVVAFSDGSSVTLLGIAASAVQDGWFV